MQITYSRASVKVINSMDRSTKQRVLFSNLEPDVILVEKIGPRGQVYKGV